MPKLPCRTSLLPVALISVMLVACSSDDPAGDPGSAGAGGSANTGGSANSGGSGNTGNASGSAGFGNSAGAGNAGGTAGAAGAAGSGSGGTAGLAGGCLPNKAPTESDLIVSADLNDSSKFFRHLSYEDGKKGGIKGAIVQTHCYSGSNSIRSESQEGKSGAQGGIVGFPTPVPYGGELRIRFAALFPEGYILNSCRRLGNCATGETNASIKFIGVDPVNGTARHWLNINHDNGHKKAPFLWVWEGEHKIEKITNDPSDSKANPVSLTLSSNPVIQRGVWEVYEYYTALSSQPLSSGGTATVRVYKNGQLIMETTDKKTAQSGNGMDSFYLLNYWNGFAPANQHVFFDDVIITTKTPKQKDAQGRPYLGL